MKKNKNPITITKKNTFETKYNISNHMYRLLDAITKVLLDATLLKIAALETGDRIRRSVDEDPFLESLHEEQEKARSKKMIKLSGFQKELMELYRQDDLQLDNIEVVISYRNQDGKLHTLGTSLFTTSEKKCKKNH